MLRAALIASGLLLVVPGQLGCNGATTSAPSDSPAPASPQEPVPGGTQVQLRLDQPAEVEGLVLTWLSFEDSRCPQGVTCVWAGEALVRINVREAGADREISLKLGSPPEEATTTTAHHEIQLTAVEPYPKHGTEVSRGERHATLIVKRR